MPCTSWYGYDAHCLASSAASLVLLRARGSGLDACLVGAERAPAAPAVSWRSPPSVASKPPAAACCARGTHGARRAGERRMRGGRAQASSVARG